MNLYQYIKENPYLTQGELAKSYTEINEASLCKKLRRLQKHHLVQKVVKKYSKVCYVSADTHTTLPAHKENLGFDSILSALVAKTRKRLGNKNDNEAFLRAIRQSFILSDTLDKMIIVSEGFAMQFIEWRKYSGGLKNTKLDKATTGFNSKIDKIRKILKGA